MGRVRWHPPKTTFCTGSRRRCQRRTVSSGASPCSTKWKAPPGFRTRRNSSSAATTSGMVQRVQVDRAASKVSSGKGRSCPSNPDQRPARGVPPAGREFPTQPGGFDGRDLGDRCRIERHIVTGAETDLDHVAGEGFTDSAAQWRRRSCCPQARLTMRGSILSPYIPMAGPSFAIDWPDPLPVHGRGVVRSGNMRYSPHLLHRRPAAAVFASAVCHQGVMTVVRNCRPGRAASRRGSRSARAR